MSNDIFGQFLQACISKDPMAIHVINEVYEQYKFYSKGFFPSLKVRDISYLRKCLIKNGYVIDAIDQVQSFEYTY